ncbi:hypothetical protein [Carnobacterium divergens]|uniref:Uncharacterized protein n=1 Tax=Carnobacterium divergens TaxID=2748 RepID=A0A7Z8CWR9_CARDV|nr:hypothetical protein [Carnobacterium divergens]TFI70092.1 hypothetical protein CKN58_11720 [Carnobacterium divergens]TFI75086.1 hypothetical protein CKN85_11775 [Carnobacterium divergens]TFI80910.1 hypothetical protein CKN56_11805 [Carnobacterium divergens]TFI93317.1 hypothetical protein CKN64_11740 [Carnobacterium divergens]TFJ09349.1 hypothetical protein CKN60_11770 [Carnobacterium divergens]
MKKKHHIIFWIFPFCVGGLFIMVCHFLKFNYFDKGFDSLIGSMINFASIIIGFYSAFYGILITIKDTEFMKNIRGSNVEKNLKYQLFVSLMSAFLILILSMVMQILQYKEGIVTSLFFYLWIFFAGLFVSMSFQTIILSLEIVFESEPIKKKFINK